METKDNYLSLADAARLSPGKPHVASVWRWCRRGVKTRNGSRIRLRHVRAGSRLFIPADALHQFFEAVAEADAVHFDLSNTQSTTATTTRTDRQRQRAIAKAERTCAEAGI